jgi:hypothetical protein
VEQHREHGIVELYLVAFGVVHVDVDVEGEEGSVDEEEEEEYEGQTVYKNDPFWDQVVSDDSDAYELDGDAPVGLDDDGLDIEHDDVGVDEGVGLPPEGVNQEVGVEAVVGEYEEGDGEDEVDSNLSHSDLLISPRASDEEGVAKAESSRRPCVTKKVPFTKEDFTNPILQRGNTFQDVYEFRKAIKQASVLKGMDLTYQKNSRTKCIAVCADKNCKYRVYGRQLKD